MRTIAVVFLSACLAMAQTSINKMRVIPSATKSAVGEVDFATKNNAHYVGLAAPDSLTADTLFRLPAADGAPGSCISTDGSKHLSFGACADASGVTIDASNPLYLYAHFRDDDENTLRLAYSRDGIDWSEVAKSGVFHGAGVRDPSITTFNGQFQIVTSPATGAQIQLLSSPDLTTWPTATTTINLATYVTGATASWAPEWFIDPPTGDVYIWVAISTAANPFTNAANTFHPYLFKINPTTLAVVSTTAITLNSTTQSRTFDYFPYYSGGTYYILYVDQQPGGPVLQPIAYATASTLTGTYTQQTTAGADYFGLGHSFQTEAPIVFPLGNGCVEIAFDAWVYPAWGGRAYKPYEITSCPSTGVALFSAASLSAVVPLNIGRAEHGTIISLVTNADGAKVFNAARFYDDDHMMTGSVGINTNQPGYMLTLKALLAPSGGIQFPEPATIGLDPGSGEYATLSACGTAAQSCWPGFPGTGRLFQYHSGNSAFGMTQFINSNNDGEASIMFGDGVYQPGHVPVSSATAGDKAIWTIGEDNAAIDLGAGNHRFFIYNKGINDGSGVFGGFPMSIDPTTGEVHVPYGITLGNGKPGAYAHANYVDLYGASDGLHVGTGAGPFTDSDATIWAGAIHLNFPLSCTLTTTTTNVCANSGCTATATVVTSVSNPTCL